MSDMHDPYDDQLRSARYRAERDQARQECERLRARLRDSVPRDAYESGRTVREEDREAAEWVRDHGGLDAVEQRWDNDTQLADAVIYALWPYGMPDGGGNEDVMDELSKRLMPEGMEWPRYDTGEPLKLDDEVAVKNCEPVTVRFISFDKNGFSVRHTSGCRAHWLTYGERVNRPAVSTADGDGCCEPGTYRCQEAAFTCDSCGHTVFVDKCMVDEIRYLRAKGIRTLNCCCGHGGKVEPFIIVNEGDECRMLDLGYERHVNEYGATYFAPKSACPPKVLDADGVEIRVGDTVWAVGDAWPSMEVLEISPDDDPDEPEHTVWCGEYVGVKNVRKWRSADQLTHRAPVLAADGRPLREGETVWSTDSGVRYTVEKITDELIPIKCCSEMGSTVSLHPSQLTHERPVVDTWVRLEEDATLPPETYCVKREIDFSDVDGQHRVLDEVTERMARDLVRRARALAERGER